MALTHFALPTLHTNVTECYRALDALSNFCLTFWFCMLGCMFQFLHGISHVELKPHLVGPIANNHMFHSEIILHTERCSLLVIGLWYEMTAFIVSLPCHLIRIKKIWASKKQSG